MSEFAHLSLHSEYSITDSIIRIDQMVDAAAARGLNAIAVTDQSNLFAMLKFNAACRAKGLKPIFGCDVKVMNEEDGFDRLILLAKNDVGLSNLIKLISRSYSDRDASHGMLRSEWVEQGHQGLIVLSGGTQGKIGRLLLSNKRKEAHATAEHLKQVFGDRFYMEISRLGRDQEQHYISEAVQVADECAIPLVATNDVRFLDSEDFIIHETRFCIAHKEMVDDSSHGELYTDQQYLRSADEMREVFSDLPDAVENACEIVKRCTVNVRTGEYFMPEYRNKSEEEASAILRQHAQAGLRRFLDEELDAARARHAREEYEERLEYELDIITRMGFCGYFLVVADILEWTKSQGIAVGPGRGSGPASLVSFVLRITAIDPIEHDLMFERLLNPERVSMPDFDIDFCKNRRDEVFAHVTETYGREAVGQIVTFDTLAAKAVIKDVTRVLGKPYGLGESIVRLIPDTLHVTLQDAIDQSGDLRTLMQSDVNALEVIDRARKLEGIVRNIGRHAGGVVISPSRLDDYVPTFTEHHGGEAIVHFDKTDIEEAGLVKFDFLGLKTVTVIDETCKAANANKNPGDDSILDPQNLPLNDEATFQLLRDDQTTAVFQLESPGMRRVLRDLQPDCLEDIIALVALFRPGPINSGVVDQFVNRKRGKEQVRYQHPLLKEALEKTHGVMVYQEDVMRVARELAGFSLGEADQLRKAMGKKVEAEIVSLRRQFVTGAQANGVEEDVAESIYDDMEKFAQYAFNRAHACSYAIVALQTAYLKSHYSAEFMASNLSCVYDDRKSIVSLCEDALRFGLQIEKPSVNGGRLEFSGRDKTIQFGLGAIKGVGHEQIRGIVNGQQDGPYLSLFDFCDRLGENRINRKMLEALIHSGALDCLADQELGHEQLRANLLATYETAAAAAEQNNKLKQDNATDLFGEVAEDAVKPGLIQVAPRTFRQILDAELDVLGVALSGHPMDMYRDELAQVCTYPRLEGLKPMPVPNNGSRETRYGRRTDIVAGIVKDVRVVSTRNGDPMAVAVLEDGYASVEMTLFGKEYLSEFEKLKTGEVVIIECYVQKNQRTDDVVLRGRTVSTIDQIRDSKHSWVEIIVEAGADDVVNRLKQAIPPSRKGRPVKLNYRKGPIRAEIKLGRGWHVTPTEETLGSLKQFFGSESVHVRYRKT